jgi:hypothetical protein
LALRKEREEQGEEHGAAGRGPSLVAGSSMLVRRREGSLVAGGGMLERSRGGARGGWKQLVIVAARAGSKWNERGAGRGTKPMKNP